MKKLNPWRRGGHRYIYILQYMMELVPKDPKKRRGQDEGVSEKTKIIL